MSDVLSDKEKQKWANLIQSFEDKIKSGKGSEVLAEFKKIKSFPKDMELHLNLSNILRRVGASHYSLIILRSHLKNIFGDYYDNHHFTKNILQSKKDLSSLETKIIISYAASLRHIGCTEESINLLGSIDEDTYPEVLLQKSICFFNQWAYHKATPLLKKYIHSMNENVYQQLVGYVNLAAGYTGLGKYNLSNKYLKKSKKIASKLNAQLLLGNIYEIEMQNMFYMNDVENVDQVFEKAYSYLKNSSGPYLLYLNKWKTLSHINKLNKEQAIHHLNKIREMALQIKNLETVRDMDFYIFSMKEDISSLKKIELLTPHKSFQSKIKRVINKHLTNRPPSEIEQISSQTLSLSYGPSGFHLKDDSEQIQKTKDSSLENTHYQFDLNAWTWGCKKLPSLKKNASFYLLISSMIRSPYRNISLGILFNELFSHQVFDPIYSKDRVYKIIGRCNVFLKKHKIPFQIKSKSSSFYLATDSKINFHIEKKKTKSPYELNLKNYMQILSNYKQKQPFSSGLFFSNHLLKKLWSCSDRQARRITLELIHFNFLTSIGSGRGRKYKILPH